MNLSAHQEALDFLFGRINYERVPSMPYRKAELKLYRIAWLLELLGDPHKQLKIVHVAGTKGKGSTCCMIESIARAAGYRTGLFTSPHLHRIEERFVVDGRMCSEDQFVELIDLVRPAVAEMDRDTSTNNSPTYFEINTAIAFLLFARQAVDLAIIEVGLGGRLDSTNICLPLVSVITSISLDHVRQLGNTTSLIAREKAGIIKPERPVVSGVKDADARDVIRSVANERNSPLFEVDRDFFYEPVETSNVHGIKNRFDFRSRLKAKHQTADELSPQAGETLSVNVGLLGEHQLCNAATAIATCEQLRQLGFAIDAQAMRYGLANVACEARVEIVQTKPTVIVDSAHNVASIKALTLALQPYHETPRKTLIFAGTIGKDMKGIFELILPFFDRVLLTRYLNNPRTLDPEKLLQTARHVSRDETIAFEVRESPQAAWHAALQSSGPEDLICVAGSFFIAAEIREVIENA